MGKRSHQTPKSPGWGALCGRASCPKPKTGPGASLAPLRAPLAPCPTSIHIKGTLERLGKAICLKQSQEPVVVAPPPPPVHNLLHLVGHLPPPATVPHVAAVWGVAHDVSEVGAAAGPRGCPSWGCTWVGSPGVGQLVQQLWQRDSRAHGTNLVLPIGRQLHPVRRSSFSRAQQVPPHLRACSAWSVLAQYSKSWQSLPSPSPLPEGEGRLERRAPCDPPAVGPVEAP